MSPTQYVPPFLAEDFYYVLLDWLPHVKSVRQLHVLELLLWHLFDDETQREVDPAQHAHAPQAGQPDHQGRILIRKERKYAFWMQVQPDSVVPALFTQSTLPRQLINTLINNQDLIRYSHGKARTLDNANQDISAAYELARWPDVGPVLFRPRGLIEHRWLGWLNERNWAANVALLALFAEISEQLPQNSAARSRGRELLNSPVRVAFNTIQQRAFQLLAHFGGGGPGPVFPAVQWLADARARRHQLRQGLADLAVLGAIYPASDSPRPDAYLVNLHEFREPPSFPDRALHARCQFASQELYQPELTKLVRTILRYWHCPLDQIETVRNRLLHECRRREVRQSRHELLALNRFLLQRAQDFARRKVKTGKPWQTGYGAEIAEFQRQQYAKPYLYSAPFRLCAAPVDLAVDWAVTGQPDAKNPRLLRMGVDTWHQVIATHLLILFEPAAGMSHRQARDAARRIWLRFGQFDDAGQLHEFSCSLVHQIAGQPEGSELPSVWIPIGDSLPVDLSVLHKHLDPARPFWMTLMCSRPDSRLALHCEFRHQLSSLARHKRPVVGKSNGKAHAAPAA